MTAGIRTGARLLLLAAMLPVSSPARADEPNDTWQQADSLANAVEVSSILSSATDLDWYVFEIHRSGPLTVRLQPPADYDLVLFWRNPFTGEPETFEGWRSDHPGTEEEELSLSPGHLGTFYLLVFGYAGAFSEEPYRLRADWPQGEPSLPPAVRITSPDGGEVWAAASHQTITYEVNDPDTPDPALTVDLDYSTNSGLTWLPIIRDRPATGSFPWTVPSIQSTRARVRAAVSDGENTAADLSDADFTITVQGPSVRLISPNGGEHFTAGWSNRITYVATDPDTPAGDLQMTFDWSSDSGVTWSRIGFHPPVPNTGEYSWLTLPYPWGVTRHARVRVIASDGQLRGADESEADFTITCAPEVELISPLGVLWNPGSIHPITYRVQDEDSPAESLSAAFEYSADEGRTWISIASGLPVRESYDWTVPYLPGAGLAVRVGVFDGDLWGYSGHGSVLVKDYLPGENVLRLVPAAGASGAEIEVPLELNSQNAGEVLQTDIVVDSTVARYVRGTSFGRAAGAEYAAEPAGAGIVRLRMSGGLEPGEGAIAVLIYRAVGDSGRTTLMDLASARMTNAEGRALHLAPEPGAITLIGWAGPNLCLTVLPNPGRLRSLSVFVSVDQVPDELAVGADDIPVTMSLMRPGLYRGWIHLPREAASVRVHARASRGTLSGEADTTITF